MTRSFAPPSFSSLDSDSNGGITLEELQSNAPGGVSKSGSNDRTAEMFSRMDSDGDGSVTSAEKDDFDAALAERMSEMQFATQLMASAGGQGGPGGSGGPGGPGGGSASSDILSALDSNSDGSISSEELSAADVVGDLDADETEALFSALDTDGSGSLSEEEISTFLEENRPDAPPMGAGGPPPPPPQGSGEEAESEDTETVSSSAALDVLSAALSAYAANQSTSSGDFWSTILGTLDEAA
ncbi:MAG: EF-hand domain-containing protein [Alphaproteobacteria bacterium]|nr:EF-hand domain-containing protein [Alphaproteobacteria bacterium]